MTDFINSFDVEGIKELISSITEFCGSVISFFSTLFGWLGEEVLVVLTIGVAVAITLRILGR